MSMTSTLAPPRPLSTGPPSSSAHDPFVARSGNDHRRYFSRSVRAIATKIVEDLSSENGSDTAATPFHNSVPGAESSATFAQIITQVVADHFATAYAWCERLDGGGLTLFDVEPGARGVCKELDELASAALRRGTNAYEAALQAVVEALRGSGVLHLPQKADAVWRYRNEVRTGSYNSCWWPLQVPKMVVFQAGEGAPALAPGVIEENLLLVNTKDAFVRPCPAVPDAGATFGDGVESHPLHADGIVDAVEHVRGVLDALSTEPTALDGPVRRAPAVMVMDRINAAVSSVGALAPKGPTALGGLVAFGPGHDGVTAGTHGSPVLLPARRTKKTVAMIERCGESADRCEIETVASPNTSYDVLVTQRVSPLGSPSLVQLRRAPAPFGGALSATVDGTPLVAGFGPYPVGLDADAFLDASSLEALEKATAFVKANLGKKVVLCHAGGSLLSHAAAQARALGVAYAACSPGELGELLRAHGATDEPVDEPVRLHDLGGVLGLRADGPATAVGDDWVVRSAPEFLLGFEFALRRPTVSYLSTAGTFFHAHTSGLAAPGSPLAPTERAARETAFLGGLYAGALAVFATTAVIGEARHAIAGRGPRIQMRARALFWGLLGARTGWGSRDDVYSAALAVMAARPEPALWARVARAAGTVHDSAAWTEASTSASLDRGIYSDDESLFFRNGNVETSHFSFNYGGPKWADGAEAAARLFDAAVALAGAETPAELRAAMTDVVCGANHVEALAHNGGWLLNKFVPETVLDVATSGFDPVNLQDMELAATTSSLVFALRTYGPDVMLDAPSDPPAAFSVLMKKYEGVLVEAPLVEFEGPLELALDLLECSPDRPTKDGQGPFWDWHDTGLSADHLHSSIRPLYNLAFKGETPPGAVAPSVTEGAAASSDEHPADSVVFSSAPDLFVRV